MAGDWAEEEGFVTHVFISTLTEEKKHILVLKKTEVMTAAQNYVH